MRAVLPALLVVGSTAFTVQDPRLTEASGIAVGLRSPGVVYLQNDSGDSARFFALDRRTGATVAVVRVPDATNVDWEDLAVAPDAAGTPSVWLADTGDNGGSRTEVRVYRVDEPRLSPSSRDRRVVSARPDVWRLRYPTGPVDAESLAVAPDGTGYVVTKSIVGATVVYRLPARSDAGRVQSLTRVGEVRFALTGTPGGPNPIGQLTATGAAFSRDGRIFAIRTYTDAYVWRVGTSLAAALRQPPVRVALPSEPQGEGIAIADGRLLLSSEGVRQPVYAVDLPRLPSLASRPASSSTAPGSSAATSAPTSGPTSAPSATPSAPPSVDEPDGGDRSGDDSLRYVVGGGAAIVLAVLALVVVRRRR